MNWTPAALSSDGRRSGGSSRPAGAADASRWHRAPARPIVLVNLPMLTVGLGAWIVTWDTDTGWLDWTTVGLACLAVLGRLLRVMFKQMMLDVTLPPVILAAFLLGTTQAVAICGLSLLVAEVVEYRSMRRPWHYWLLNVATALVWSLTAGLVASAAPFADPLSSHAWALAVWVLVSGIAASAVNYLCILPSVALEGGSIGDELRSSLLPPLPWVILSTGVAMGSIVTYREVGQSALIGLGACMVLLIWLLTVVAGGERNRYALEDVSREREALATDLATAEQRQRQRLAEKLHDDALQHLAIATQDLAGGLAGEPGLVHRAQEDIASAMRSLRKLMVDLDAREAPSPGLAAVVDEVAAATSVEVITAIDDELGLLRDDVVAACMRELLRNVDRHACATRAWVTLTKLDEGVCVEVADNGRGATRSLQDAVSEGHLGLLLVGRRASLRGGSMSIDQHPSGGFRVRVLLPAEALV